VTQSIYLTEDFTNLHEKLYLINLYLQSKNKDKINYGIVSLGVLILFIITKNNNIKFL